MHFSISDHFERPPYIYYTRDLALSTRFFGRTAWDTIFVDFQCALSPPGALAERLGLGRLFVIPWFAGGNYLLLSLQGTSGKALSWYGRSQSSKGG